MCDYSLHHVRSRPAKVGDKLTTQYFGTGTVGFAASEDESVAVCVLPGTELSFADEVRCVPRTLGWSERVINHKTAIFRQVNEKYWWVHHDALEFPDGQIVLLTLLKPGQQATVLQLPASASVKAEQGTELANSQLVLPKSREPIWRQLGIPHGVLDISVP
jgi:hypothetical protein